MNNHNYFIKIIVKTNNYIDSLIKKNLNKKLGILCLTRLEKVPFEIHQEILSSDGIKLSTSLTLSVDRGPPK